MKCVHTTLLREQLRREIKGRYRGAVFGMAWPVLNSVFILAIYTYVFGHLMHIRWQGAPSAGGLADFALTLYAGLIMFELFADVTRAAPSLILANRNYVKKVVFPLEIIPVTNMLSALFHAAISFVVLMVAQLVVHGQWHWESSLVIVLAAPVVLTTMGIAWMLSALGVYLRDTQQLVSLGVTAAFFLTPIVYSQDIVPGGLRWALVANPLASGVENIRRAVLWGMAPDWMAWAVSMAVGLALSCSGYSVFMKAKKGFADVL